MLSNLKMSGNFLVLLLVLIWADSLTGGPVDLVRVNPGEYRIR